MNSEYQNLEISTGDPFEYKIDFTIFIVLICMEKSIRMKRINLINMEAYIIIIIIIISY